MSRYHLTDIVHPELRAFLEIYPSVDVSAEILPMVREAMAAPVELSLSAEQSGVTVADIFVPGRGGSIRVRTYRPEGEGVKPAVLHFHGGGYLVGRPEMAELMLLDWASQADCAIFSVDYRLAPEHPYPAASDDGFDVGQYLFDNADDLGIDKTRIVVAGESAGGGLAAGLALRVRDQADWSFCFQLLTYPMLDSRSGGADGDRPNTGQHLWTTASNRFAWRALLGEDGSSVPAYASATHADTLDGLAPTYIAVGSIDLFAQENLEYAARLIGAGVPVELQVYPGAYHGFDLAADTSAARAPSASRIAALRRALRLSA